MKDISLHLFDILENSVKAGATWIQLELGLNGRRFCLMICDNGPGFPDDMLARATDPYCTTRTERPVGLGLALLKQSVEEADGELEIANRFEGGARVEAFFNPTHIDARPLGDIIGTVVGFFMAWPDVEIELVLRRNEHSEIVFDAALIRQELDGVDPGHPEVQKFIRKMLKDALDDFQVQFDALNSNPNF